MLHLPVLLGTVRHERKTLRVARFVAQGLAARPGVETRIFDPAEWPFGNLVVREWEMEPQPPAVGEFVREMARADGFVVVAPEYNHSFPGALKNMLDALFDEWNRKPFALVGTGGVSGGIRMIEQLRPVISGLGAITVPASVAVQFVGKTFADGGPVADAEDWSRRFDRLFSDLEWYARALRRARDTTA